jgi:drug/metabolite transporter (DMT)-like permease
MTSSHSPSTAVATGYGLLAIAICCYTGLWLVSRVGVTFLSPYWYAVARLGISCLIMFALLAVMGQVRIPRRSDWPIILSVAVFMFGGYGVLFQVALKYVHAGRASMLGYTFPIWVMLLSVIFLKERPSKTRILGFVTAMAGLATLFNPLAFDWNDENVVIGNELLLLAALLWSPVLIHLRVHRSTLTALQLAPWQLLASTAVVTVPSYLIEGLPTLTWTWDTFWVLAYAGPIGTCLGMWGLNNALQRLSPIVASVSMLAVPVLSLAGSIVFLGEELTVTLAVGMLLIITGVALVSASPIRRAAKA